ncbi:hypothetical protein ACS3SW_20975 [Roseobacteraceae bacterium S113]
MWLKLTLNGVLMPFFRRMGNRITLPSEARWNIPEHWGAYEVTYYDPSARRAYTVKLSRLRAIRESLATLRVIWAFRRDYDRLKAAWQEAYPELTSDGFWHAALDLDTAELHARAAE